MSEMVERVARSIGLAAGHSAEGLEHWVAEFSPEGNAKRPYRLWEQYIPKARAAIQAMREPTLDILNVAETTENVDRTYMQDVTAAWRAMIDEALK